MSMMFNYADLATEEGLPDEVCAECATGGIRHAETGTTLVYCVHTATGAARSHGQPWTVACGIAPEEFRAAVSAAIVANEVARFERFLHCPNDGRKSH